MNRFISTLMMGALVSASAWTQGGKLVVVKMADAGKTIQLRQGAQLEVDLTYQGGTGYRWELAAVPSKLLTQVGTSTTSPGTIPGGLKTQTFRFNATGLGSDYLSFNLGRTWRKGLPQGKHFSVKVNVVR